MIRRPPRSTQGVSSAASDVYKRQHHTQPPQFRDGEKLWPCCNKRSKDFNAFLSIKGCRELDSHSSEKQVVSPQTTITTSAKEEKDVALGVEKCPRCSNGFACEMHPEESKKNEEKMRRTKELKEQKKREEELERAKMDPRAEQTCKRCLLYTSPSPRDS